jgi:membrane-associated phospholipid phosphatase
VAVGIALFPPGLLHRWLWGAAAVILSFVMACSRAYLGAHWLSDVVAGVLLGASIAVLTALIVESVRRGGGGPRPRSVPAGSRASTRPGP